MLDHNLVPPMWYQQDPLSQLATVAAMAKEGEESDHGEYAAEYENGADGATGQSKVCSQHHLALALPLAWGGAAQCALHSSGRSKLTCTETRTRDASNAYTCS